MPEQNEPEPTLAPGFGVDLRGWYTDDEQEARDFANRLWQLTHELSRYLDLSRLSKVIVAFDYQAALASVRGGSKSNSIATANEFGEGAAMTVPQFEDGVFKSTIVACTPLISKIFGEEDSVIRRASLQNYVHELIHADDQAFLDKTFPGGAAAGIVSNDRHGALLAIVQPARAEYEATRRSALYEPTTGFQFLDMLERVFENLFDEVRQERRKYNYRLISLEQFWPWLQERCRFLFQALGYALGHADGVLNSDLPPELKAQYEQRLAQLTATEFGWTLEAARAAILPIHEQDAWTGLEIFDPLIEVAVQLLSRFDVALFEQSSGYWVDVPVLLD